MEKLNFDSTGKIWENRTFQIQVLISEVTRTLQDL